MMRRSSGWPPAIGSSRTAPVSAIKSFACPVADSIADSVRMPRLTKWPESCAIGSRARQDASSSRVR